MAFDYSFPGHTTTLGDHVVTGYGDGDGVAVARATAATSDTVGADGTVTVSLNADERADLTILLARGSQTNKLLYAILKNQKQLKRVQAFSFLMRRDHDGEEILGADVMWIQQEPDQAFGSEAGSLSWVLRTDRLRQYEPGVAPLEASAVPAI